MSSSYRLAFIPAALKEWKRLDRTVQLQFKKKLAERLENPHVPASQLYGLPNYYKIKLRATGYRLVYEVQDKKICVLVIAVGRRDKLAVYKKVRKRHEGKALKDAVKQVEDGILEEKHKIGYEQSPVAKSESSDWESEQEWGE